MEHRLLELVGKGQDKSAVFLNLFVGQRAKRIQEYSRGSFVGLSGFGQCCLKFCLGHLKRENWNVVYRMRSPPLQHEQNVAGSYVVRLQDKASIFGTPTVRHQQINKGVVGIYVLLTRSLFGGGTLRRFLRRVSLGKPTSAPLQF